MAEVPAPPIADAEDAAEAAHAPAWVPTILLHVFYPDSRKVGFGWWLWLVSTFAAFYLKTAAGAPALDASTWLICTSFAAALIGGGTIADARNDLEKAKLDASTKTAPAGA